MLRSSSNFTQLKNGPTYARRLSRGLLFWVPCSNVLDLKYSSAVSAPWPVLPTDCPPRTDRGICLLVDCIPLCRQSFLTVGGFQGWAFVRLPNLLWEACPPITRESLGYHTAYCKNDGLIDRSSSSQATCRRLTFPAGTNQPATIRRRSPPQDCNHTQHFGAWEGGQTRTPGRYAPSSRLFVCSPILCAYLPSLGRFGLPFIMHVYLGSTEYHAAEPTA